MKVLMLSERWFPSIGGGEEHILHLTRELVKLGCEITLITRSISDRDHVPPGKENHFDGNFQVHRMKPSKEFENLVGRATYIPLSLVKSLVSKEKFDVIHAESFSAGLIALTLKKIIKVPAVCTVHGIYQDAWSDLLDSNWKASLYKKIERFVLFRDYDRIITVDKHFINVAKEQGFPLDKVRLISNGVDLDDFDKHPRDDEDGENTFLAVGRLVPQKGLEYLLRASRILKDENIEHRILIVGEGPLKSDLEKLAAKLGVEEEVRLAGRLKRDELLSAYSRARYFVLPSLWEGLPITLLEAWAARLPVIATKVGGIPDVCVHEENSILVEPKDPEALASSMSRLIGEGALSERLGREGRRIVEESYTWQKVAESTFKLYKEIVRGP
jgi:glycosyltransferase involved in cell wall biosynthesis